MTLYERSTFPRRVPHLRAAQTLNQIAATAITEGIATAKNASQSPATHLSIALS
ncbi:hypothetical protein [Arthrobacter sp. UNC362MFTsu5.1]|uniref:hypothetical protein n=1 Tax=Arthrobacter sp. UNC362MFTsu5.1 TaxID=1449044 RepID=UPI0012DE0BE1|nr:hypothetical protein [Arthrobacter sp. UNC362MFTsu5.1]